MRFFLLLKLALISVTLFAQKAVIQMPNGVTLPNLTTLERDSLLKNYPVGTIIYNMSNELIEVKLNNKWSPIALPTCITQSLSTPNLSLNLNSTQSVSNYVDITESIPLADVKKIIPYNLPKGMSFSTNIVQNIYRLTITAKPTAETGTFQVDIITTSNCGISNSSTLLLQVNQPVTCISPSVLCNNICVNIQTDKNNCGSCGVVCPNYPNAITSCVGGNCMIASCNSGFANCDGMLANGCETNLSNSTNNCGACGNICSFPNASAVCVNGTCSIGACNAGFANCDGMAANGCEVNLTSSNTNCGTCGVVCPSGRRCVNGVCVN